MLVKGIVKKEGTVDMICDICGESCKYHFTEGEPEHNFEYGIFEPNFGYFSHRDLMDSSEEKERQTQYLCETCYNRVEAFIKGMSMAFKRSMP